MNFIDDFLYKKEQKKVLQTALGGVFEVLKSNVDEVDRNINISKLLTYRRIQFQRLDITNVMFSLSSLLNNSHIMTLLGVSKDFTMEKRIEIWDSMTPMDQALILDAAGYYLELTNDVMSSTNNDLKMTRYDIIDFELCDMENNALTRNVDYVFYDNKLILLKEFFLDGVYRRKYLFLKDIVIDTAITEDTLGRFMDIPSNKEITKVEYNEILKGFTQAAAKGPVIGEFDTALNKYKSIEGVRIYDKFNANPERRDFWDEGKLSNFDFIVAMPIRLITKEEKLRYIESFLLNTKPAYANFIFMPEEIIIDKLPLKRAIHKVKVESEMQGLKDKGTWKSHKARKDTKRPFADRFYPYHKGSPIQDSVQNLIMNDSYVPIKSSHLLKNTLTASDVVNYHKSILKPIENIDYSETQLKQGGFYALERVRHCGHAGTGTDAWELDRDYFDTLVMCDCGRDLLIIIPEIVDTIPPMSGRAIEKCIANILDKIKYKEKNVKALNIPFLERVYNNTQGMDGLGFITDDDDFFDPIYFNDTSKIIKTKAFTKDVIRKFPQRVIRKCNALITDKMPHSETHENKTRTCFNDIIVRPVMMTEYKSISKIKDVIARRDGEMLYYGDKHVSDNLPSRELDIKSISKLALGEKVINHSRNIDGLGLSADNNSYLDCLYVSDALSIVAPLMGLRDSLRDRSRPPSYLLKTDRVYDRISTRENAQKTPKLETKDIMKHCKVTNAIKCDSIFDCDSSELDDYELDSGTHNDKDNMRDRVSILLIPK